VGGRPLVERLTIRRLTVARRGVVTLVLLRISEVVACCPQQPPFKPCMRFSRTRLPDIVHREACAATYRTVPERRWTPRLWYHFTVKRRFQFLPTSPCFLEANSANRSWT
jgi:hypothetical protein